MLIGSHARSHTHLSRFHTLQSPRLIWVFVLFCWKDSLWSHRNIIETFQLSRSYCHKLFKISPSSTIHIFSKLLFFHWNIKKAKKKKEICHQTALFSNNTSNGTKWNRQQTKNLIFWKQKMAFVKPPPQRDGLPIHWKLLLEVGVYSWGKTGRKLMGNHTKRDKMGKKKTLQRRQKRRVDTE